MHIFLDIVRQCYAIQKFFSRRSDRNDSTIKFMQMDSFLICDFFCSRFLLKKLLKMSQATLRFCNDHKSISSFVQSMQKSSSDKGSDARQIFVTMIQKSNYRRLFDIPHTIGMREYSFWLINNQIIVRFQHHGNIDSRSFIQNRCIQISRDIVYLNDIA